MSKWIPLSKVNFDKEGYYHIDTRDFHCIYMEDRKFELPESKFETTDVTKLKEVLEALRDNTGGTEEDWRHIWFQSKGGGWLKYIRIRIKEGKIMIFDMWQDNFNEELDLERLSKPIIKKPYGYIIDDGPAPIREEKPEPKVKAYFGENKEFKWKKNRNGNPFREYNKDKW